MTRHMTRNARHIVTRKGEFFDAQHPTLLNLHKFKNKFMNWLLMVYIFTIKFNIYFIINNL